MDQFFDGKVQLFNGDSLQLCQSWESPVSIICDGPYGVSGYDGDPVSPAGLADWYLPHLRKWAEKSTPLTTLWFWGTELSWAETHPAMKQAGWDYVACNIWNKGMAHAAGNVNTQVIRRLPVVSEVCVQYVRRAEIPYEGRLVSLKYWLRQEFCRAGLSLNEANTACGVANAATRKYLTQCHLWYFPPAEMFGRIAAYANEHGKPEGRPYFSFDGKKAVTINEWERMRSKFKCPMGVTNVWDEPALRSDERIKDGMKAVHYNQKPLHLMSRLVELTTDVGDVVWEPFGGLFSGSIAAGRLNRRAYGAEISPSVYQSGLERFSRQEAPKPLEFPFDQASEQDVSCRNPKSHARNGSSHRSELCSEFAL
jgi:site-specific DNA-methyltransferase (adenine-specific)